MDELELTQPEEPVESVDTVEAVEAEEGAAEAEALQEATEEPGAHVEETQTIEQAEAVEQALQEAVESADVEGTPVPIPTPEPVAEDEEDMQFISGPSRDDLPPGSGILEEPHETVAMAEGIEEPGIADRAEIPEGLEFQLAWDDDDDKDEATPINLPGPVAEDDEEDMQLISGPSRDDLPDGTGILVEPHETVEMAEGLKEPGLAERAEIPEGMEFKLAGEGDGIGRDDHPRADSSELSEAQGKDDEDNYYVDARGVIHSQEEEDVPESGPDRDDLPPGTGILEEPHETVAMAEGLKGPGLVERAEIPEGMEFKLAGEDEGVGRDDHPRVDSSELSEAGGKDDDKDEATPINLPGPVAVDVGLSPDDVKLDHTGPGGQVAKDHPGPGGNVASEDDWEAPVALSPDDVKSGVELDHPGTGGNVAGGVPVPLLKPELDHTGPGGNVASEDDWEAPVVLSPDDVKRSDNLQPAPAYEDMSTEQQSVVEIIGKAIADEEYRGTLLTDARSAAVGYAVTGEDLTALGEMTEESFDFFATEVEKRLNAAVAGLQESAIVDAKQQILKQVVHAVWRDLNPGSLAYVLAYKIPQKHL